MVPKKKGELLHVEKKTKMWVQNRFLSVPFQKGSIAAYEPGKDVAKTYKETKVSLLNKEVSNYFLRY